MFQMARVHQCSLTGPYHGRRSLRPSAPVVPPPMPEVFANSQVWDPRGSATATHTPALGILDHGWHCWFHWNIRVLSGVMNDAVKFFNFVGKNIVIFHLAAVLSFVNIWTWMTTLLAKSVVSGLDVACVLISPPSTHK